MQPQVVTIPLAESSAQEDAVNEFLTDEGFVPAAPLNAAPPVWAEHTTYPKGAIVEETGHGFFRSQAAANKENVPHEDADAVHWAPVAIGELVLLQNPSYNHTPENHEARKEP